MDRTELDNLLLSGKLLARHQTLPIRLVSARLSVPIVAVAFCFGSVVAGESGPATASHDGWRAAPVNEATRVKQKQLRFREPDCSDQVRQFVFPLKTGTEVLKPQKSAAVSSDELSSTAAEKEVSTTLAKTSDQPDKSTDKEQVEPVEIPPEQPETKASEESDTLSSDRDDGIWHARYHHLRSSIGDTYYAALTHADKWTKRIELGGRFLRGNSDQDTFNLRGKLEKAITEDKWVEWDLGGEFGRSSGEMTTNRWFGNGTVDFSRTGKWILYLTSKNEFDEFQNLNWRGTLSGGIGYRFINEKKKRLIARIGPGVTHEFFFDPTVHRTTPDVFAEVDTKLPVRERSDFENKLTLRPSVDDLTLFRLTNRSGLLYRIDDDDRWKLKLGFWLDYNSAPTRRRSRADYTTSVSLVYTRK